MPDFSDSLRNEFRRQLNVNTNVDLLLKDNNTDYIKWLENKLEEAVKDFEETNNSNKEDT